MERKVGEIFKYNGEWYQCTPSNDCKVCAFYNINCDDIRSIRGECIIKARSDGKNVIFKKLEKVGEPIRVAGKLYQKIKAVYITCDYCSFYNEVSRDCGLRDDTCFGNETFVEIKQNKEDMNKKKLNLKEFDLEAAKAGNPVCTRDGRKARIICFDAENDKPIVALIYDCNRETVFQYLKSGRFFTGQINGYDLMMLPEKKEGWVNIYKDIDYTICGIYSTKEKALKNRSIGYDYITTLKIEWEE